MKNRDFKVGDRVIGWHNSDAKYKNEVWTIGDIHHDSGLKFIYPEGMSWNTTIENIKHCTETIIGYKLRDKAYERAACVIIQQNRSKAGEELTFAEINKSSFIKGKNIPTEICFEADSLAYDSLSEAGVLDLWFVPVFEDDKFADFSHSEYGVTLYKGVSLADKFIKSPEFSCVTSFQMKVNGVKHNFSKADVELIKEYVKTLG